MEIVQKNSSELLLRYTKIRERSILLCFDLHPEDQVVQPIADVSPPKWHLGHTTWFFETFILKKFYPDYQDFHPDFSFVFNSYYETVGKRVLRANRGNMTRPLLTEVHKYRKHVDAKIAELLSLSIQDENLFSEIMELGLQHEQQHQELLATDIKYIFGHNPLFPALPDFPVKENEVQKNDLSFISIIGGIVKIGHTDSGFCFDNELGAHNVLIEDFEIRKNLVSNSEYIKFLEDGGYKKFEFWLSDGWEWLNKNKIQAPMYWHKIEGSWYRYSFEGLKEVDPDGILTHISYYEADAFAAWADMRLPTEFEWEAASKNLDWGQRWEWTKSAYLAYPGFKKAEGAIGEYNGKFMINQMVLKGASIATPPGHSRYTYRNFFQAWLQWQFTGIRLVR